MSPNCIFDFKTGKVKGKFQDTIFGNHKKYVDFISKNIFHIQTDSLNHHLAFKSLELKFQDLIQEKEHEILILESQSENLGFNELSKLFFLDTLKFSKLENDFSVIDSNLLKLYFSAHP